MQLTPTAAAILSDVFNIEWGLRKLTLRECDLDDLVRRFVFLLPSPTDPRIEAETDPTCSPHPRHA